MNKLVFSETEILQSSRNKLTRPIHVSRNDQLSSEKNANCKIMYITFI